MIINNYKDFIAHLDNHKPCTLRSLIHFFAYDKDKNWKFEQEIPEDNFCFTFHPLWWRYYLDLNSKNCYTTQINNFFQVYPHLFGHQFFTTIPAEIKDDYCALENIYQTSTKCNFEVTKESFIRAYKAWLNIREHYALKPNIGSNIVYIHEYSFYQYIPLKSKSDEELEALYNKAKEFYRILNEFEDFLFNLEEWELLKFNAKAKEEKSKEFFPITRIANKRSIYSYHKGLINKLNVKKSDQSNAYLCGVEVEFDTHRIINHFQKEEEDFMTKEEGKRGEQGNFDENDKLAWKYLFDELGIEFEDKIFSSKTLDEEKSKYYANLYKQWFDKLSKSNQKNFSVSKIRRILSKYYKKKGSYYVSNGANLPKNKIRSDFTYHIEEKIKKKSSH